MQSTLLFLSTELGTANAQFQKHISKVIQLNADFLKGHQMLEQILPIYNHLSNFKYISVV